MPGMLELAHAHQPVVDLLATELAQVEHIFERQLASDLPPVNRLCRHIERYRGKMLRPTLTLLSGLAGATTAIDRTDEVGTNQAVLTEAHRVLAAVCEMIHMATLVHDDVLDEANMRRQGSTVNYLRGNEVAVLLGDYLISNSFHLCSTLGRPEINRRIGEVTNTLCAGELLQLHHREYWSLDQETYFEIIDRKTASLIGLCCELGATESGAGPEVVAALSEYGRLLGIAFQIQDDLLDIVGDQTVVGKTLGKDLEKGKLTLPIILYLADASGPERDRMLALLADQPREQRTEEVARLILDSGTATRARQVAEALVEEAKGHLSVLPESPIRMVLGDLADAVVTRRA